MDADGRGWGKCERRILTAKNAKNAKDQKDTKDGPRGSVSNLHFSFSCSAVLAHRGKTKKRTVMFYLEAADGE
jgi:hypothetical protein